VGSDDSARSRQRDHCRGDHDRGRAVRDATAWSTGDVVESLPDGDRITGVPFEIAQRVSQIVERRHQSSFWTSAACSTFGSMPVASIRRLDSARDACDRTVPALHPSAWAMSWSESPS
jgi:hypothetical protein